MIRVESGQGYCNGIKCNALGDYIIVASDDWRIWDGKGWRQMTVEEQIEISKTGYAACEKALRECAAKNSVKALAALKKARGE
jgi:hypothetical protein